MSFLISYSSLISTIWCLKNSFGPWNIDIFTVLWISTYNKSLNTLWTFHSKLKDFCCMKVIYPCFNWVETNSFSNHVVTAFTSNMKWSLISNFTSTNSFPFNNNKRFFLWVIAFSRYYFCRIEVFWSVKIICSSCG